MKPIDVIRKKLDPDLLKYHSSTLCSIVKIKDMKAAGIVAMVRPLNSSNESEDLDVGNALAAGPAGLGGVGATAEAVVSGAAAAGAKLGKAIAKQFYDDPTESLFPVVIANRPPGWEDKDIKKKYYVFVLSPIKDRLSMGVGLLVPKTALSKASSFIDHTINRDDALKDALGDSTTSSTYTLVGKEAG